MNRTTMDVKKKMLIILVVFVLGFLYVLGYVTYWQLARGSELSQLALEQQTRDKTINSKRGAILDRNGNVLAASVAVETLTASPVDVKKNDEAIETISQDIAKILELEYTDVYDKLNRNTSYVVIKRKMDKAVGDKVRKYLNDNNMMGFSLITDTKRYYPYDNLASHVIGFAGMDNQGLAGIELEYDSYLKGASGRLITASDASGSAMPFDYEKLIDPEDGLNVVLTIDENIQRIAEKYIEQAVEENQLANGACCIVMEVKTGEILAMTTKPDFNLNDPFVLTNEETLEAINEIPEGEERTKKYSEELNKLWRNKAVVDAYEPGSTFKIFTSAMAIEENVITSNELFYCNGYKSVTNYNINCWKHGGHGPQNFKRAVQNSCNPAFIEIGARVGASKFYEYMSGLGFREKTGIDLPGEDIGLMHERSGFNEVELATYSFGQGFTVTPIQMITAVNAIANDGMMIKPHIVKRFVDSEGNVVKEFGKENIRQIVSQSTSKQLREVLESVVSEGSGSGAYIRGYRVGGKTGTSEKIPRGNSKYVASFIGIAPSDEPEIICLVLLDEPTTGVYFGGIIATPVARSIMEETLAYLGIEPSYTVEELATMETTVPNVVGMTIEEANKVLSSASLKYALDGGESVVLNQLPKAGVKVNQNSIVMLYTEEEMKNTTTTVPNLLNMTVSQAATAISNAKLNINVVGAGSTTSNEAVLSHKQSIEPGTVVEYGTTITVEFKRIEAGE
ncbi:MAG: PASTA domain-containing protein [Clostridia bacterium]|nr:PASTA domain-containing protein [Clostridia bacterium]